MKRKILSATKLRRLCILLAILLFATMFFANNLHAMLLHSNLSSAKEESVVSITLEGLQTTGCDPSRYTLFNPNDDAATIVQVFYNQDDFVESTIEDTIQANEQITVDLDMSLPTGFVGYVEITSNWPITGTILPDELIASFSYSLSQPFAPVQADFFSMACGDFDELVWDFGDGVTSTVITPSHTYTVPGTYTASLTISDDIESDTRFNQIEVMHAVFLPVAAR